MVGISWTLEQVKGAVASFLSEARGQVDSYSIRINGYKADKFLEIKGEFDTFLAVTKFSMELDPDTLQLVSLNVEE